MALRYARDTTLDFIGDSAADLPSSGRIGDRVYVIDESKVYTRGDNTWTAAAGAADVSSAWPVGSVFIAVVSTNPATLLGFGTWTAFAAGRVLIGLNAADPDFDTAEETGGAKTVASAGTNSTPTFSGSALGTHSHGTGTYATSAHSGTAVADHASHTHTYTDVVNHTHPITDPQHNHTQNAHTHVITSQTATTGSATSYEHGTLDTSSAEAEATEVTGATTATNNAASTGITINNPTGGVATGTTAGPSVTLIHSVTQPSAHTLSGSSEAVSAGTPAGTVTAPTFTGSATSVVQPYIVVYMWKRVS